MLNSKPWYAYFAIEICKTFLTLRQYANLQIDMLIASFCDDAGIKADKVAEALKSHTKKTQVEQVKTIVKL